MNVVLGQIDATFDGQSPTCPQGSDGSLCLTSITGGIPPYNFAITSPTGTFSFNSISSCFGNLFPGPYNIAISDNYGNNGTVEAFVPNQNSPLVITATGTDAYCGQSNGSVCCTVTGGTGNYTYLWIRYSDFQILGNDLCLGDLDPNESYSFTVYDAGSPCIANVEIVVQANNLNMNAATTNTLCTAPYCSGSINLTPNGAAPYTYTWIGSNGFSSNEEDIAELCPGSYSVSVTDNNGCSVNEVFEIELDTENLDCTPFQFEFEVVSSPCPDQQGGSICLFNFAGGLPPYTLSISNSIIQITDSIAPICFDQLAPGTYAVTLSDQFGEQISENIEVPSNTTNMPELNTLVSSSSCFTAGGTICCDLNMDESAYRFGLIDSNGLIQFSPNPCILFSPTSDLDSIYVMDTLYGCVFSYPFDLPSNVILCPATIIPKGCDSIDCIGSILANPEGNPPFNLIWTGPDNWTASGEAINGLCADWYSLDVTDAMGCFSTFEFEVLTDCDETSFIPINMDQAEYQIYPNPFHSQLKAQLPANAQRVDWLDATGRLIHSENVYYPYQEWNLGALPIGVYHIQVILEDGRVVSKKVVKD